LRLVVLYLLILPLARLMSRVGVSGDEHLRNVRGPVLFVANHITAIDPALILSALPARFRNRLAVAMIGEMLREWRSPPASVHWVSRARFRLQYFLVVALFNVFPLPQQSGFRRSFSFVGESIDRGFNVLVFPEGQRTATGVMNPFMAGTGLLIDKLGVPVVPMRIDGLFPLKQRRQYFARPGQVSVRIGEPFLVDKDDDPVRIARELEKRVREL
jgi:long-chain acyl-CoA synthetase